MSYVTVGTPKKVGRSVRAFAAALGITLGLVASVSAQAPTTIRLGYVPILTQLHLFTAMDKGYFKEAGLDVQVRSFPGGANVIEALGGNSIDLANSVNVISLFQARAQGFDFVVVAGEAGIGTKLPEVAMTMVRRDSGINSAKDLEGKRFGLPNLQNINWLYNMEYLSRSGVNTSRINWVEIGVPRAPAALLNRQVDAATLIEPFITVAQETGEVKVLHSEATEIAPGGLFSVAAAKGDWAKANRSALTRYVAALKRAFDYNQANQEEARARLTRHTKIDQNLANKMSWPVWKLFVERKDLQIPMDLSVKYGLLKEAIPVDPMLFPTATGR